ncbi:hypothetical protein AVEN_246455-1, partial [Araneus ventricosus]
MRSRRCKIFMTSAPSPNQNQVIRCGVKFNTYARNEEPFCTKASLSLPVGAVDDKKIPKEIPERDPNNGLKEFIGNYSILEGKSMLYSQNDTSGSVLTTNKVILSNIKIKGRIVKRNIVANNLPTENLYSTNEDNNEANTDASNTENYFSARRGKAEETEMISGYEQNKELSTRKVQTVKDNDETSELSEKAGTEQEDIEAIPKLLDESDDLHDTTLLSFAVYPSEITLTSLDIDVKNAERVTQSDLKEHTAQSSLDIDVKNAASVTQSDSEENT